MTYDIIIKNGKVFQTTDGSARICDVAVNGKKIAKVGDLSADKGNVTIDASGTLVAPGLIDEHLHLYTDGSDEGIPADLTLLPNGITSAIDG
ncbi:MAG: hydrolase, partial [Lachnospiraceae bacterium]|nr:hydrolase [Lachnospiraceae bacterium]